ncbi:MAG: DUF2950 domain-containing protein [Usitatibacter sp.]
MKIRMHILVAAVAGALAASLATGIGAQTTSPPSASKPAAAQRTFATADDAAAALIEAVRAKDVKNLVAIVGPGSASWLFSGDKTADANDWEKFAAAYQEKKSIDAQGDTKAILKVGNDEWPFPAPLVKRGGKWAFDANAGREEIINRRVGRNELDAIQTMLAIVDAQREYAATDADGNGFADYARRFRSTPGKKDGLYWPAGANEPESPLGPLVAVAAREGYKQAKNSPQPYHGYYYRILTSQGKDASGGAYDYMVGDKLLGGFAVVAYPARYGVSGVTTFLVNHEGVVYEKDLGAQTGAIGAAMTRYNPDATWRKAQ